MFDTSVFELLATVEREFTLKIVASNSLKVFGCSAVRKELRETPRHLKVKNKRLRVRMLSTYDLLVSRNELPITDLTEFLAKDYIKEYKGNVSRKKLWTDFLIVATASLKNLDIVCTHDNTTMASTQAIKAYQKINEANTLRTPKFIELIELKSMV